MAKKAAKAKTWRINGRRFKKKSKDCYVEGVIELPELEGNLQMRVREVKPNQPNKPVVKPKDSFGVPIDANLGVYLIKQGKKATEQVFSQYLSEREDKRLMKLERFIGATLNLNYGITFDRALMLKILSQPNCEGLRAYLCAREEKNDYHVSLVMVGVDQDGYDLNYTATNKGEDTQTESLLVEYGYPPGGGGDIATDEHYVLLRAAENK